MMGTSVAFVVNEYFRVAGSEINLRRVVKALSDEGIEAALVTKRSEFHPDSFSNNPGTFCLYDTMDEFRSHLRSLTKAQVPIVFYHIPRKVYDDSDCSRSSFFSLMDEISPRAFLRFMNNEYVDDAVSWYPRLSDHFESFIAQCPGMKEHMRRHFPDEAVRLVCNGVPTDYFVPSSEKRAAVRHQLKIPQHANVYLFVGRYIPSKGIHELLSAWSPDYGVLLLAGYDPAETGEVHTTRSHNVFDLGVLPEEGVRDALQASDFFVFPSRREGLSNALLEALSSGVIPVVYKSTGGMEILDGNAVEIGPAGIGAALSFSSGLGVRERQQLSASLRQLVLEHFTMDHAVSAYRDLLFG